MNTQIHESVYCDEGALIGDGTRIWHFSHVCTGAVIGEGCSLGQNVHVGPGVRIGQGVRIQNNVFLCEGVTIEDDVFLGPCVCFTNVLTPRAFVNRKDHFRKTLIKRGASVGANATILCGITIGAYAMIGAGSVVTREVEQYALVYGNPARRHGTVERNGECRRR